MTNRERPSMFLCTTENIPGYRVTETLGLVTGSVVMTKHIGRDIAAVIKGLFGGEVRGYTELLHEARSSAIERMSRQAAQWGANAVVGVRLSTTEVMQGCAEVTAYGTAVKVAAERR